MLEQPLDNTNIPLGGSMLLCRSLNICTTPGSADVRKLPRRCHLNFRLNLDHCCFFLPLRTLADQGPKLRLTGRQCDQKLGVGDQNFRTGRQQATNLLSPRHLKFQGKRAFFKENLKFSWIIVVKRSDDFTIAIFTWRHIVSTASLNQLEQ